MIQRFAFWCLDVADRFDAWWAWSREPQIYELLEAGKSVGLTPAPGEKPAAFKERLKLRLRAPV